jgi:hypothetical protein
MGKKILAAVLLAGLVVGGYLYSSVGDSAVPVVAPAQTATSTNEATRPLEPRRTPPKGYKEYYSEAYRFALMYPDTLKVAEYDEGGGALTVIFQDLEAGQGFQIFIVPYRLPQVTQERFVKDVPSGVRAQAKDILLDGVAATAFLSKNDFLGETREVWGINNGYLYEVTAPKALDQWLDRIMQTWNYL